MKYFLDTEFIESGPEKPIKLISLGMISEDNRSLYLCNLDCDFNEANDWVKDNVYPHLPPLPYNFDALSVPEEIKQCQQSDYSTYNFRNWYNFDKFKYLIQGFIGEDREPEFWAYFADYDWVAFCQVYGTMMHLPGYFPKYCNDLKQVAVMFGIHTKPPQKNEHDALADAKWNKDYYEHIIKELDKAGKKDIADVLR